jgi:hypothetical protein
VISGVVEDPSLAVEASETATMSVFFLPIGALLFFTIMPSVDLLRGVILGIIATLLQYSCAAHYANDDIA